MALLCLDNLCKCFSGQVVVWGNSKVLNFKSWLVQVNPFPDITSSIVLVPGGGKELITCFPQSPLNFLCPLSESLEQATHALTS